MSTEQWLLLTDYSSKYRISVSTLRRRIKNNQIPYRFDGGKYFIVDVSPTHPEVTALQHETPIFPELKTFAAEPAPLRAEAAPYAARHDQDSSVPTSFAEQLNVDQGLSPSGLRYPETVPSAPSADESPEPLITTATNLLNELKRAYSNILHEKEEQMIQLKEEVSDLKTLVRVLEDETERLRRQILMYQSR